MKATEAQLTSLLGKASLLITVDPTQGQRYQVSFAREKYFICLFRGLFAQSTARNSLVVGMMVSRVRVYCYSVTFCGGKFSEVRADLGRVAALADTVRDEDC